MSPKLSVVVPLHNAEPRLARCLDALAAQTLDDLEVIVVDDGSTDDGAVLADAYVRRDPRFRLVRQDHRGPGPARNAGVLEATGEYLAFAEVDDVMARRAYDLLAGSLELTGSDLAVGAPSGPVAEGTRLERHPCLLRDRTLGTKVFRRAFWDSCGLEFPAGPCPDPPVTVTALLRATAVDVLPDAVRSRRPGPDTGLVPRLAGARSVRRLVAAHAPRLLPDYDELVLIDIELRALLAALPDRLPDSPDAVLLTRLGAELLAEIDPALIRRFPSIDRLRLHLLGRRMLPELLVALRYDPRDGTPVVRRGRRGRRYAEHPFFEDAALDVPRSVYDVTDELVPEARIDRASWTREGRLRIEGHAYIPYLDADGSRLRLWLTGGRWRRPIRVPVRRVLRPDVTAASGQSVASYDHSGFTAEIDPARLGAATEWRLYAAVANQGLRRRRMVGAGGLRATGRELAGGVRVQALPDEWGLLLRVRPVEVELTGHRRAGDQLELSGRLARDPGLLARVTATTGRGGRWVRGPIEASRRTDGWFDFRARLPLAELIRDPGESGDVGWEITLAGGIEVPLPDDFAETDYRLPDGSEFVLTRTRTGLLHGVGRVPLHALA
ncbi:hypothetical protein DPM19_10165 [Actinomadura craniellae]|uniref:Glycosyltransferase 2-like domain-containing protein n=1 Tax=Actinomadura craniellae TaxID=2231787 RepID=A0A365H7S0_9ACTN|nr:glycosyltransferase [Actinomadura craniellae]RAY15089.1 hypothetical protein DPM19_10165 [Actinomadura craniellae]